MRRIHKLLLAIVAFWLSLNFIQLGLMAEPQSYLRVFWGGLSLISLVFCLAYVEFYAEEKR